MTQEAKAKTDEKNSERMRRAWVTRRANLAAKSAGPSREQNRQIGFRVPLEDVQKQMVRQFLEYLDFAIKNKDSGVLNTDRFRSLMGEVKPYILEQLK